MNYYARIQKQVKKMAYFVGLEDVPSEYFMQGALAAVLALGLGGSYYGYKVYIQNRESKAYQAFIEVAHAYKKAEESAFRSVMPNQKESENLELVWKDVEVLLDAGYAANSSSYLAPFFLSYKASVLLEQGKSVDEAYEVMKQAVAKSSSRSEFYDVLTLKAAKMACDCSDTAIQAQGLQELQAIAGNKKSVAQAEALYTLGIYYMMQNDVENAKNYFSKIVKDAAQDLFDSSLWVDQAKEKLASL